jgi:hypothetical protein
VLGGKTEKIIRGLIPFGFSRAGKEGAFSEICGAVCDPAARDLFTVHTARDKQFSGPKSRFALELDGHPSLTNTSNLKRRVSHPAYSFPR